MFFTRAESTTHRRLAFLINIVSPYRVPMFQQLAERFELFLILSGNEDNRNWDQNQVAGVRTKVAFGWTIKGRSTTRRGDTAEQKYLHLNPGYMWELLRFHPQAIVSTEMGFRSLVAVIYGQIFNVPVWIWWEGGIHTSVIHGRSLLRRVLRRHFFARLVRHWFGFGDVSTEYLESLGVARSRIVQSQLPVDERLFSSDIDPIALPGPRPRALFIGRLVENKGIFQLLNATSVMQTHGAGFSLVIVGDGPEAQRVESEIKRLRLENVEQIRWMPPEQMPSIYRACDFLIFPTLDDVWGLVVNEAILSGLPVVASRYAGCAKELLSPESIFDPLDVDSFRETYQRAIQGEIARPEATHLQPLREVAQIIADNIASHIE